MKNFKRLLLLGAFVGTAAFAQETAPPAPVTAPPPPPAPEAVQVDGLIHVQKLPTPAQLTSDAEAENMTVTRMEQQADRIIVTYRYASGNTRTFAYTTTLPANPETEIAVIPAATAPAPSYTVIYTEPAPVYYYPRYVRSYDPYYWPSSSFSLGIGFGRSFGYGHYGHYGRPHYFSHGGHRGHHHGHGRGRR